MAEIDKILPNVSQNVNLPSASKSCFRTATTNG